MMKRRIFSLVIVVVMIFMCLSVFVNRASADGDGSSTRGPNMGAGPMPPLTPKQKAIYNKKEADFQKWLSKQPKDVDPLDIPLKTNKNVLSPLTTESGHISIPLRTQEKYYWCGPASAQEVLDYDWGYLSTKSKYSQSFLADKMGTNSTDGTYVYKLTNALNQYEYSSFLWVYYQISSDETTAANDLYLKTKEDISGYEGLVYHTNTYPYYGYDVWGERYGLVGYFDPYSKAGHSTGHYVVGYGYIQEDSGKHRVSYLDSYDGNYGWGTILGRHTIDARNMATCVIYNAQYIIY